MDKLWQTCHLRVCVQARQVYIYDYVHYDYHLNGWSARYWQSKGMGPDHGNVSEGTSAILVGQVIND